MRVIPLLKRLLPDRPVPLTILRGPFRGASIALNPRVSLRKVFGLYERENDAWLERVLARARRVIDVGAADGYFTFGCEAAMRRHGRDGEVIAIEADARLAAALEAAAAAQRAAGRRIRIVHALAGRIAAPGQATLDGLECADRRDTLVKIDVEGAELDVVAGAMSWVSPSNHFLIEVHRAAYLDELRAIFARRGVALRQVDQRPLPLLGRERRDPDNWWLRSDLAG